MVESKRELVNAFPMLGRLALLVFLVAACKAPKGAAPARAAAEPATGADGVVGASDRSEPDRIEPGEPRSIDDAEQMYACHEATGSIVANLAPGMTLRDAVAWAVSFSCKNIVYPEDLSGARVTVVAPKPLSPEQAWQLFVVSVEAMGFRVRETEVAVIIAGSEHGPGGGRSSAPTTDRDGSPPTQSSGGSDAEQAQVQRLPAEAMAGIVAEGDSNYVVERAALDRILADPRLMRGARIVPSISGGKPNGFKLYAIRPNSLYAKLGFRNGDTIHEINGHDLANIERALEVYAQVRSASRIEVTLSRRGKRMTLRYRIE